MGNIGNDSLHSWMVLVSNYLPYDCLHRFFWKNNPREGGVRNFSYEDISQDESESIMNENQNDIIDLDDVTFKPSGNSLSIKKKDR